MRIASVFVCGFALTFVATAQAQTKFSMKAQCEKPDPNYNAPVGDQANRVMSLSQDKCSVTQGGEIAGTTMSGEEDTFVSDISGSVSRDRGYSMSTLANGDHTVSQWEGSTTLKDNAPVSGQGTWSFVDGTGKLKGVKGKGTYKAQFNSDGTATLEVQGEYRLPTSGPGY